MLVIPHHTQAVCGFHIVFVRLTHGPYLNTQQHAGVGVFQRHAGKAASILGAQHGRAAPTRGISFFNQRNSARIHIAFDLLLRHGIIPPVCCFMVAHPAVFHKADSLPCFAQKRWTAARFRAIITAKA